MRHLAARLVLLLAVAGLPATALAGATSPKITIASAEGSLVDGARSVRLGGVLDFENALQTGYGLHVLVYQGTRFVRYPVAGDAVTGTSAALADGTLSEAEVPAFLLEGAPTGADVRIVTFTPTGCLLTLPAEMTAGPARVVLVAVISEGVVFSNVFDFSLP